jgi:hypothetical protein
MPGTLFLGYASKPPLIRDTLYEAGREIASTGVVKVLSWEDLKIGGRVIIRQIFDAIDTAAACAFDVSTLNQNVLFELGYAIARAKPIWLLLDETDTTARATWRQFQLLTTVGYAAWANAEDVKIAYLRDRPDLVTSNLYEDLIEPAAPVQIPGSLLYIPPYHNTEPARKIDRILEEQRHKGLRLFVADPQESALNPLQWYAAKVIETQASILHFDAPRRELAALHNARTALVAGLACGLERPVLMLAEEDYAAPLDYGYLLNVYGSSREAALTVDAWLRELNLEPRPSMRSQGVKLAAELRGLRFGEHVAENEIDLLSSYFVETAAFDDVISNRNAIFVGRKGAGKTANMYQVAGRLSEDVRNLVVVIKPPSYEFSSLLGLLSSLPVSLQEYSIEALWKFLLYSEIARAAAELVEARRPGIPYTADEKKLLEFFDSTGFGLRQDFGARFERTVADLQALDMSPTISESKGRDLLNEALHSEAIARLRALLGPVLKSRQRVAVLIDNLDKGWDKRTDLPLLAQLLLGLLSAIGRVTTDFGKSDIWRSKVNVTVAAFLRSDIYAFVRSVAREPDKLGASVVKWDDKDVLLRVLEERFLAARPDDTSAEELWNRFFCPTVRAQATREFLISSVLPRPRDLIYLCNAAVVMAVNRGAPRVEEEDAENALYNYSQFAFESLLVENGVTVTQFKNVLFGFLGEPAVLTEDRVRALIRAAGIDDEELVGHVLERLKNVGFLGVETAAGRFEFTESGQESERAAILAQKFAGSNPQRLTVHRAYRPYLEIAD